MANRVAQGASWLIQGAQGRPEGPYTSQQMTAMLANGIISTRSLVQRMERDDQFRPVAQYMQKTQDPKLQKIWYHLDDSGVTKGPISSRDINTWLRIGILTLQSRVRRADHPGFRPLEQYQRSKRKTGDESLGDANKRPETSSPQAERHLPKGVNCGTPLENGQAKDESLDDANKRIKTPTPRPRRHDSRIVDGGAPPKKRKAQDSPSNEASKRIKTSAHQPKRQDSKVMARSEPAKTSMVQLHDFPEAHLYDLRQRAEILKYENFVLSEMASEDWKLPAKSKDPGWTPKDYDDWIDAQEKAEREKTKDDPMLTSKDPTISSPEQSS